MHQFSLIESIIEDYESFDWNKLEPTTDLDDIKSQIIITDKINEIAKRLFDILSQYIISGDFLREDIDYFRYKNLIDSFSHIKRLPETNYQQEQALLISSNIFKRWIRSFYAFSQDFNRRIKSPEIELSFAIYKEEQLSFITLPLLKNQTIYLDAIIRLYRLEIALSTNGERIKDLHIVKDVFEGSSSVSNELRELLIDKVDLLIKKVKQTNAKRNIRYNINFTQFSNDTKEHPINYLKDFDIDFTEEYINEQHRQNNKKGIAESFRDFFIEMKFFKEIESLEQAKKTFKRFEDLHSHSQIDFDTWAYGISYNYLYNNILSLELKNKDLSLKDIDEKIETVKIIQYQNSVNNYFPYKKLCSWIESKIDKDLSVATPNNVTKTYIDRFDVCLKKYRENIIWSKKHLVWPYQPRLEECIIITSSDSIPIFCASSFILPINYDYEEGCLKKLEESLSLFQSVYKTSHYLEKELEDINNSKKEVQEALRKNIEILSIFAAIVLFVMGNIQIYSQVDTLNSAIAFTLAFGYVIAVFILLISLIIRSNNEQKESKKHKIKVLWFLAISAIIFICIIFFAPNLPLSSSKNHNANKVTTIQQNASHETPNDISVTLRKK
ncbi:MAG TPA: hypothetical protein VMW01_11815 [Williamwhitmania sp.]|nr:hypothetical protein [Williamwhitmania sp.]